MNLHEHKEEFEELIAITADYIGVPADAVRGFCKAYKRNG